MRVTLRLNFDGPAEHARRAATLRLNFDGPAEHARRAATRAEPELATGARIGATRAVHAIAIAIAVCLGLLALLPSAWRTDRK
jgi:hypothetical protein